MNIIEANDSNFEKLLLEGNDLVIVLFGNFVSNESDLLQVLFDNLKNEIQNLKFIFLDIEENPDTAFKYSITNIPTVMLFLQGKTLDTIVGFVSVDDIIKSIKRFL